MAKIRHGVNRVQQCIASDETNGFKDGTIANFSRHKPRPALIERVRDGLHVFACKDRWSDLGLDFFK